MANRVGITDVFKSTGQPTITYVERDRGKYEHLLSAAIDGRGQLCLITGPSKTGKTTLYKRVLDTKGMQPLVVRCDKDLSPTEFWRRALEQVNFSQIATLETQAGGTAQISGKVGGTLGWKWLAGLLGEFSGGVSGSLTEGEIRQRILASPSPHHLIPLLQQLPVTLVIEDFHYLPDASQKVIFQQWKSFIDNEVSVLVLGTTHHAVDIAYSNRDLLGRISQIDVARWRPEDLEQIISKGFSYFGLTISDEIKKRIARESVGLPIITQQACEQILRDKGVDTNPPCVDLTFDVSELHETLHRVAVTRYGQLESYYKTITQGPRRRARRYDTYELVLACFTREPIQFALARYEIDNRLRELPVGNNEIPPPASLTSMLKALRKFQESNKIELLEWREDERTLYITEPSFLFYLRWREKPKEQKSIASLFSKILEEHFKEWRKDLQILLESKNMQ